MNWVELAAKNAGIRTWDVLVECELSLEDGRRVERLGYYGKIIEAAHGPQIRDGIPYKAPGKYSVTSAGPDGASFETFDTLADTRKYILAHMQWSEGQQTFMTDYRRWTIEGTTLEELGIEEVPA